MEATAKSSQALQQDASTRRDWLLLVLASIGKIVLFATGSLVLWSLVPLLFGLPVTTVASGSMEPGIRTGDVVASLPVAESELRTGQVVLFDDPAVADRLKLHRIIDQSEDGLQTQGDANPEPDPMLVEPSAVVGVGFVRVPSVGVPINWLHRGNWVPLGIFLGALAAASYLAGLDGDLRRRDRDARGPRHSNGMNFRARNPRLTGSLMPLTAVLITAVTAVYLIGGSASAAFSSTTASSSAFGASTSFPKPWDFATFHWGYSESGTLALDDVGTAQNGTLSSGVTRSTEADNPFVTLNGSSGQISGGRFSGAAPNTFSVETWFKTTTTRGGKLIGYGNSQSGASTTYDRHLYMTDAGTLTFGLMQPGFLGIFNTPVTLSSPQSYNDGQWHLATVSMSSTGGTTLYVDGVAVAANGSMTTGQNSSNGYWRVGYDSIGNSWAGSPTSNYFAGSLDNTTLYPTALSATEIARHFSYGR